MLNAPLFRNGSFGLTARETIEQMSQDIRVSGYFVKSPCPGWQGVDSNPCLM